MHRIDLMDLLKKITRIAQKKLERIEKRSRVVRGQEFPVTLLELKRYQLGAEPIPLNRLYSIMRFYGCTHEEMNRWNTLIAVVVWHRRLSAKRE